MTLEKYARTKALETTRSSVRSATPDSPRAARWRHTCASTAASIQSKVTYAQQRKTKANAKIVLFFGHVNRKNDRISARRHEFWPQKVDVVKSLYASALETSSQRWQQCQRCLCCSNCFILNYQVNVWNCAHFYLARSIINLRTRLTTWR